MPRVILPDGTIAHFSDDTPLEQIEEILQARFPADEPGPASQLPQTLEPGETYRHENGSAICHMDEIERYVVRNADGTARGFRTTFADALTLADSIQPPPPPRRMPAKPVQPKAEQLMTAHAWNHEIDRHVRKQESGQRRERIAAQNQKRFRNRGTLA